MAARFAWIDTDEASRRKMLDFIDQFRDQGTLDELGIGQIRDAFADYFFPGTTTVQTRARYFLFVPWIYRELERRSISSAEIARKLYQRELALLHAMLDAEVGEGERLIGRQSKAALQRWPSSIYWAGLETWRIRVFEGSQHAYHRRLDAYYQYRKHATQDPDEGAELEHLTNWDPDPHFPEPPDNFPEGVTMRLRPEDAQYLVHRIRTSCQGSLLALLLGQRSAFDATAIWALPSLGDLPAALRREIAIAKYFALAMHGANLLYYWSVANAGKQAKRTNDAEKALASWGKEVRSDWTGFAAWADQHEEFWKSPALRDARVGGKTRRFVKEWISLLLQQATPGSVWRQDAALQLIKDRERQTKPDRARLWDARQRERWDPAGLPGLLDYRWGIASWILHDIYEGLHPEYVRPKRNED
jgi:hypothetical protein